MNMFSENRNDFVGRLLHEGGVWRGTFFGFSQSQNGQYGTHARAHTHTHTHTYTHTHTHTHTGWLVLLLYLRCRDWARYGTVFPVTYYIICVIIVCIYTLSLSQTHNKCVAMLFGRTCMIYKCVLIY